MRLGKISALRWFGVMPDWNVGHVADMRGAFKDRSTFNGNITLWDTSVTTMRCFKTIASGISD